MKKFLLTIILGIALPSSAAAYNFNLDALLHSTKLKQDIVDFESRFGTSATCTELIPMTYDHAQDMFDIELGMLKDINALNCHTAYCQSSFDDHSNAAQQYIDFMKLLSDSNIAICIPLNYPRLFTPSLNYSSPSYRSCPAHSTGTWGSCICETGYFWSNDSCVSYSASCKQQYGPYSYGDRENCYCSSGYQFNGSKTECVAIPRPTVLPSTVKPPKKVSSSSRSSSTNTINARKSRRLLRSESKK